MRSLSRCWGLNWTLTGPLVMVGSEWQRLSSVFCGRELWGKPSHQFREQSTGAHTQTHITTQLHIHRLTHGHTKTHSNKNQDTHWDTGRHTEFHEAHNLTQVASKMCMLIFGKKWNKRPAMCKVFFCFFFLCKKRCLPIWRNEIEASMKYEPGGHTCPVVEEFTHLWFKVHARSVRVMAPSLQCTPSNSPGTVGYTCYLALLVPVTLVFGPRWHHEFAKPV